MKKIPFFVVLAAALAFPAKVFLFAGGGQLI